MTSRRAFLAGLAALSLPHAGWAAAGSPVFLSAARQGEGHALHGLTSTGDSLFAIDLPARGHAAAAHPARPVAVAFARRPGTYALAINCVDGRVLADFAPPQGRQFNGHGAFSADGEVLYTSEVVAEGSAGRIGLWETRGFRRIGEWDSGGLGPHEIRLLPDGRLAVANGGIATDPHDRRKLNIATMRPNLSILDPDGRIADLMELPAELAQNSIRHLALSGGALAFAMQWEGDPAEPVPLLGLWQPGKGPILCQPPEADMFAMKGYAGSVAATGKEIAVTSPPGGVVMVFGADGLHGATHRRADICGVSTDGDGFVVTDGNGLVARLGAGGLEPLARHQAAWDNHLVRI